MVSKEGRVPIKEFIKRRPFVVRLPSFLVKHLPNRCGRNRLAVIVGTKVDMQSSGRHRLKRQIMHMVLQWPNREKDIVITLLPSAKGKNRTVLKKELSVIPRALL